MYIAASNDDCDMFICMCDKVAADCFASAPYDDSNNSLPDEVCRSDAIGLFPSLLVTFVVLLFQMKLEGNLLSWHHTTTQDPERTIHDAGTLAWSLLKTLAFKTLSSAVNYYYNSRHNQDLSSSYHRCFSEVSVIIPHKETNHGKFSLMIRCLDIFSRMF